MALFAKEQSIFFLIVFIVVITLSPGTCERKEISFTTQYEIPGASVFHFQRFPFSKPYARKYIPPMENLLQPDEKENLPKKVITKELLQEFYDWLEETNKT